MNRFFLTAAALACVPALALAQQPTPQDTGRMRPTQQDTGAMRRDTGAMRGDTAALRGAQQDTGAMRSAQQDTGAMRGARQDTSGMRGAQRDTAMMGRRTRQMHGQMQGQERTQVESHGAVAGGPMYRRWRSELTNDQVRELQTALKGAGCSPGAVDGVLGPHTSRAMSCAARQRNVEGGNVNELFRSLNLNFTVSDSLGMGGEMHRGTRSRRPSGAAGAADTSGMAGPTGAVHGYPQQTGGRNEGRVRPPAESAGMGMSPNARPARAAQHGQGMHDSTTSKAADSSSKRPPR
ncbi:MAG TPA: peptidoglycan-binding domain-containing protein [Gemmatimonadaceae bacterium]|nr:peptidoglycan-binding domain-containing protein [Gemmatimonadaceae bacterium]